MHTGIPYNTHYNCSVLTCGITFAGGSNLATGNGVRAVDTVDLIQAMGVSDQQVLLIGTALNNSGTSATRDCR